MRELSTFAQPMYPSQPNSPATDRVTRLDRALEKSETVKESLEQSAHELLVINAVLKQEIPEHVQTGDVAQALQKSDQLEGVIQESAEELAQVNEALVQEIGERQDLERELAETKTALAQATGESPKT